MINILTKDNFETEKDGLANAYFPKLNGNGFNGITIKNNVSKYYEDEYIVKECLDKGKVNEYVVAWKAGRLLEHEEGYTIQEKEGDYLNGYGGHINKAELKEYLDRVRRIWDDRKLYNCDDFLSIYGLLANKEIKPPKNFGCVYIINLIFFLSKGNWPIYDKFAHKAVKAIYMEKAPWKVYVGDAPSKYEVNDVVNMYEEYIWLLENIFGKRNIDRTTDRALWVYGHFSA